MESLARTAAGLIVAATAAAIPLNGTFALLGGTQHVTAHATVSHPHPNDFTVDIVQSTSEGSPPIRSYTLDMTKFMHVVAISDDFRQFMHTHPTFDPKTGDFHLTMSLDPAHAYNVYADSEPKGMGEQVFRFTIPSSTNPSATTQPLPPSTPSPDTIDAGSYAVTLAKTTLPAQSAQSIALDITKNRSAANDLQPYLGAAGHAVFVDTATLAYVHVHPMVRGADGSMNMRGMDMNQPPSGPAAGPHLMLQVPGLPVGTYKLWFQFRAGGSLYVAPFTLAVR